ncbi:TetR/AcrR family transcriptional regulator [Massilia sp. METH4]|uniref:TetR/AcrR family transcriptional regulator n=1 Tax=Massilia sp. METH4 TaxID=3123041 RepID=UPI0030D23805
MARPKSEEKREEKRLQLLHAAAEVVAQRGAGAPTAAISALAGVAEGTLFRYFPTKEALFNELYLYIFRHLCDALHDVFDPALDPMQPLHRRAQRQWNSYIDWGLAHPAWMRALTCLAATDALTEATLDAKLAMFPDVALVEAGMQGELFGHLNPAYGDAMFMAIADATLEFAAREPLRAEEYKLSGFKAYARIFLPPPVEFPTNERTAAGQVRMAMHHQMKETQ